MSQDNVRVEKVGAFDIRNFIGTLLGIYGIALLGMGLFGNPELEKTGGVNANLWTGVALAIVGLLFITWAKLAPLKVAVHDDPQGEAERDIAPVE